MRMKDGPPLKMGMLVVLNPLPHSDTHTSENWAYSKHRTLRLDSSLQYLVSVTHSQMSTEVGETAPRLSGRVAGEVLFVANLQR